MNVELLLLTACGVEDDGVHVRVYVVSPSPDPLQAARSIVGHKTDLFHLFAGPDAESIREFLAARPAWNCWLRVPLDFSPERGIAAVRTATRWHGGERSALFTLAATRRIEDEVARDRLRREATAVLAAILENTSPGRAGEYLDLLTLRDVILTAPLGIELCDANELLFRH